LSRVFATVDNDYIYVYRCYIWHMYVHILYYNIRNCTKIIPCLDDNERNRAMCLYYEKCKYNLINSAVQAQGHCHLVWLALFLVLCTHRDIAFWCDWPFSCCCVRIVTSPFVVTGSFLGVVYASLHRLLVWLTLFLLLCTHRYIAFRCDWFFSWCCVRIVTSPFGVTGSFLGDVYASLHRRLVRFILAIVEYPYKNGMYFSTRCSKQW